METSLFSRSGDKGRNAASHDVLEIRVAPIDYFVHCEDAAKVRPGAVGLTGRFVGGRYPSRMTVGITTKGLVAEIETQIAQLPKLISDVFAGVCNGTV